MYDYNEGHLCSAASLNSSLKNTCRSTRFLQNLSCNNYMKGHVRPSVKATSIFLIFAGPLLSLLASSWCENSRDWRVGISAHQV